MDVVFVADASSSVADPDFLVLCDLTTQIYRKFLTDIGDELRASMVTYASTVYEDHVISLNDYDRTTFQNKLCIQRVGFILHACVSKCSVKSICLRTTTALTAIRVFVQRFHYLNWNPIKTNQNFANTVFKYLYVWNSTSTAHHPHEVKHVLWVAGPEQLPDVHGHGTTEGAVYHGGPGTVGRLPLRHSHHRRYEGHVLILLLSYVVLHSEWSTFFF